MYLSLAGDTRTEIYCQSSCAIHTYIGNVTISGIESRFLLIVSQFVGLVFLIKRTGWGFSLLRYTLYGGIDNVARPKQHNQIRRGTFNCHRRITYRRWSRTKAPIPKSRLRLNWRIAHAAPCNHRRWCGATALHSASTDNNFYSFGTRDWWPKCIASFRLLSVWVAAALLLMLFRLCASHTSNDGLSSEPDTRARETEREIPTDVCVKLH